MLPPDVHVIYHNVNVNMSTMCVRGVVMHYILIDMYMYVFHIILLKFFRNSMNLIILIR